VPARSAVTLLPQEVRDELDRKLVAGGFAGYEALSEWLVQEGFEISKSSLHRYGQKFEDRVRALKVSTDQARAIVAESPDDEGAIGEALMRLVQEKLFNILLELEISPDDINISSLTKSIAQLGRTSIAQKKYAAEVKEKTKAAADAVEKIARKGGLSQSDADKIRSQILGIAS
jgi:hypothetical protein